LKKALKVNQKEGGDRKATNDSQEGLSNYGNRQNKHKGEINEIS
jgi:hypothetical protein